MCKTELAILNGHGESMVPANVSFAWFFRCLRVLGYTTSSQSHCEQACHPCAMLIGDPSDYRFGADEIAAIREFIKEGGAAFVLGRYGGDEKQSTNLSDLFPGLIWENTLVKSKGETTYPLRVHGPLHPCRVEWLYVDCPCSLAFDDGPCVWHPVLVVENDLQCLSAPYFDRERRQYLGDVMPGNAMTVCAAAEYGKGKIICLGSRWMFSNQFMGFSTHFLRSVLAWLTQEACPSREPEAPARLECCPDVEGKLRALLLANEEHLFCFLAATGFYQGVLSDQAIGGMELGVPWCEPVWVQDSFDKCVRRLQAFPRVRHRDTEAAEAEMRMHGAAELVRRFRAFPMGHDWPGELLRIRGLSEAFARFEKAVLECVTKN